MKISDHVSYEEATSTNTGISNTPNAFQLEAIKYLCERVFEPLRERVGDKIKVVSIFRSEEVNKAVGGSKTSQHCKGEAMDIDDTYGFMTNNEMGLWIMNNLTYDQLIFEKPINGKSSWIHVSIKRNGNRKQALVFNGKKYLKFTKSLVY